MDKPISGWLLNPRDTAHLLFAAGSTGLNPSLARALRAVRVARLLRAIKSARGIRSMLSTL